LIGGHEDVESAWNFGPTDNVTLSTEKILQQFQKYLEFNYTIKKADELSESSRLALDCSKAQIQLNWQPAWDTQQTIEKTAEWYRAFYEGENIYDFTMSQLLSYQENI